MALFSERTPIPTEISMQLVPVDEDAATFTTHEVARKGKEGVIRTVHGVYHFDLELAKSLRNWLDDKIKAFEEMKNV